MKSIFEGTRTIVGRITVILSFLLASCSLNDLSDPNNPSISLVENATLGEIQNLVTGIESGMRNRLGTYYDGVGVIGREYYRFSNSDPRFTADLLGKGASVLDNNTFYTTAPFADRYRVVKNVNLLIEALEKTSAAITDQERKSAIGYAKTIKAFQLLLVLNQQYGNGIRIDVGNANSLGPRLSLEQSYAAIAQLLEEGKTNLTGDTGSFIFTLSKGFAGFDSPSSFLSFNRALAARVALYSGNDPKPFLQSSFLNMSGDLNAGPSHSFSVGGGDQTNPLFFAPNSSGETRIVHPSFVDDAEAGDHRLDKVLLRDAAATLDDLSGNYDFWLYKNNQAYVPIIRNEELILIYAEANVGSNNTEAIKAIDVIRVAAGLAAYSGGTTSAELMNEILNQRRYSLFGEGHRWVDMRRAGKLGELPIDRSGDDVWTEFPVPATEGE